MKTIYSNPEVKKLLLDVISRAESGTKVIVNVPKPDPNRIPKYDKVLKKFNY